MPEFTVQIIVFSFSGIILITGIYLVIKADTKKTNISAAFTVGFLSLIVAATINPNEIIELSASGKVFVLHETNLVKKNVNLY